MQIEVYNMLADGENLNITLEAICDSFPHFCGMWNIINVAVLKYISPQIHGILRFLRLEESSAEMMTRSILD